MTMVFALTLGVAYADEGGLTLHNGVTDFTGQHYDALPFGATVPDVSNASSAEGSGAGSLRAEQSASQLYNGGNHYDTLMGGQAISDGPVMEIPRTNWAGKTSSVRNYDIGQIQH